ncbi:MAG: holo-ACP synthase [Campylobacterota bacterium]
MIGIDLIKTSRMNRLMERFGEKALQKFLCENEISLVKNHKTAAGFWAVKEAFSKALGVGIGSECSFHDIEISKTPKGAPKIDLSNKILTAFNIKDTSVSITHDGEYAIAVVAIEKA